MGLLNNDWVQLSFRGKCFNQTILLTHHYLISGDFPAGTTIATDLDTLKSDWLAGGALNVETSYLAALPPQFSLLEVRAQRLKATRSAFRSTALVATVGTNANPATVACDSAGLTLRTINAGRNQVSCKKIGPMPDGGSAAGALTAAYTALVSAIGSKLITAFVPTGTASLAVPIIPHPDMITFDILTNFFVQETSRVMNRRVVGRGE